MSLKAIAPAAQILNNKESLLSLESSAGAPPTTSTPSSASGWSSTATSSRSCRLRPSRVSTAASAATTTRTSLMTSWARRRTSWPHPPTWSTNGSGSAKYLFSATCWKIFHLKILLHSNIFSFFLLFNLNHTSSSNQLCIKFINL